MQTGGHTRPAQDPNLVANLNGRSRFDQHSVQMTIYGAVRISVIDADVITEPGVVSGLFDNPRCRCPNVLVNTGNVDASMVSLPTLNWMPTPAVARRDAVALPKTNRRQTGDGQRGIGIGSHQQRKGLPDFPGGPLPYLLGKATLINSLWLAST